MGESPDLAVHLDAETHETVERLAAEWEMTPGAVIRLAVLKLVMSGTTPVSSDAEASAL